MLFTKFTFSSVTEIYFRDDPLKIVKGERQYLIDDLGNKYMDCINNVAHGNLRLHF